MVYVIVGPTCSGKTSAAIALSEKFNAPIINGDAFQIYKDMNIGTSKIAKDDPAYAKHYLLDIITPDQTFSVMEYQKIARKTLDDLLKDPEEDQNAILSERFERLERKHARNWIKLNKSFEEGHLYMRPTNKTVANLLGICERQVAYYINSAKKEIDNISFDNSFCGSEDSDGTL